MAATTTGTSGNDTLIGGSGADTLDGGAGSDFLNAGAGDDILRYVLSQNTTSTCKDIYIGGSGKDTLVMVLTEAEWAQDSVRSQLLTYLNHLKLVTNAKTGEVSSSTNSDFLFTFGTSTLSVQMVEKLQVVVGNRTVLDSTDTTASAPILSVTAVSGNEDTLIDLSGKISATLTDTDGTESISGFRITGIPQGATLINSAGNLTVASDGSITLSEAQLAGLKIMPPSNSDIDFNLNVTAYSTELNGNVIAASVTKQLAVTVNAVADAPNLMVSTASGNEDTAIDIGSKIIASLNDADGSETLSITISGIPTGATLANTAGDLPPVDGGSVTLSSAQLAGLTITPPPNSDVDISLSVTATATEGQAGITPASVIQSLLVTVNAVADAPTLSVQGASGNEDTAIDIGSKITASLNDTDGSETLTITISGIPAGATLANTAGNLPPVAGGSITISPDKLAGLTITPPSNSDGDFSLNVTATATEAQAGITPASSTQSLAITVNAVADVPNLTVGSASGNEDAAIDIGSQITASLNDTDDSETLSVTIGDIPAGATLTNTAGDTLTVTSGSITITPAQLAGLKITPPSNSDVDFNLSVTATATEAQAGITPASTTQSLAVAVNAVADAPTLSVQSASGNEDTAIAIGNKIVASLNDTDGSETLTITIGNIPTGATLANAAGNVPPVVGGSVTLTPVQLAGLTITPPSNSDVDISLSVTATATEGQAGIAPASATQSLLVTVNAVADVPNLNVTATSGDANTAIAIGSHISAALTDTDSSESLTITISGIPAGATLDNTNHSVPSFSGSSVTLTPAQLAGLTITPPTNSDADFNLAVTATSTEAQSGVPSASVTQTLAVTVNDIVVSPQGLILNGGTGNTDFTVGMNDGNVTINDLGGGNDTLTVQTGSGTAFSTFNFERVGDSLVLTLGSGSGSSTITVQNHFGSSTGAVETVFFSNGGTAYGYSLGTAGYNLQKDLGGTGQADVIASSALGQSLTGGNGNDMLFGNDGNDIADGGIGNDLLVAGAGNDRLIGGDGNDVLVGGTGSDTFVFNTAPNGSANVDAIKDFNANGEDFIELASSVFTGLSGTGTLNAGDFTTVSGTGASANFGANTNVNIIFDTSTGNLYYDTNGGDAAGRTLIASLTVPAGTVDATDFKVV